MIGKEEIQSLAEKYYSTSEQDGREKAALKNKLANAIIDFFKANHKGKYGKYEDAYYEGIAIAINQYSFQKGESILNYASVVISNQIKHNFAKENGDGLTYVPQKAMKNWKKIETHIREAGQDLDNLNDALAAGMELNLTEDEIIKAFEMRQGIKVASEEVQNEDGDSMHLYDKERATEDADFVLSLERDIDGETGKEKFYKILDAIERVYKAQQNRFPTKPCYSVLMTNAVSDVLLEAGKENFKRYSFVDKTLLEEIEERKKRGEKFKFSQIEIGKYVGLSKERVSTNKTNFMEKLNADAGFQEMLAEYEKSKKRGGRRI